MRCATLALALLLATPFAFAQAAPPAPVPPPADVAAPPADAETTASGLASKRLEPGAGEAHPQKDDRVTANYTGWTTDGAMFDSTRGKPTAFSLDRVMAGLAEGVQLMVAGEKRRLWIPEPLAYKGKRSPKGMLVFDVELIAFVESPTRAPADVKQPPADAERTISGMFHKRLAAGTGTMHASPKSTVSVHYTGWTTDGKLFDSSVVRGTPAKFSLDDVIPGWKQGVPLMVEGEKRRFWIPQDLAYKGKSPPYGMLVFDIELITIH